MNIQLANPIYTLKNQRGDVLIAALIVMIISAASSTMMLYNAFAMKEVSKKPRIRSQMLSVESKVRAALISPLSYTGCTSGEAVGSKSTCALNTALIESFERAIPGAQCPAALPNCGINISASPLQLLSGGSIARATVNIVYEGEDVKIKPISVVMDIPGDILQQRNIYRCPAARPVFLGLLPDGRVNCRALPPLAGPGEFANVIDLTEMKIEKTPLPTAFECPAGQIIGNFKWMDGGNKVPDPSDVCINRPNAFSVFKFTPQEDPSGKKGDVVYTPNPDY